MKTEELLRYERMYAEIRKALGTPWLDFGHPSRSNQDLNDGLARARESIREGRTIDSFQTANDPTENL